MGGFGGGMQRGCSGVAVGVQGRWWLGLGFGLRVRFGLWSLIYMAASSPHLHVQAFNARWKLARLYPPNPPKPRTAAGAPPTPSMPACTPP